MAHSEHNHQDRAVGDFVEHAVVADTNTPRIRITRELHSTGRSRIVLENFDPLCVGGHPYDEGHG